ncbi:hypothetical protein PFICI_11139 [Pestalotiopsis fici W106-1]|uniref:Heterokaryon incompatibility domain-containing protein n=1 Tax=Pestalotiopsis fici (strain W106-1 / CGMCC3.15140) TaxID=1229662 RepID=W3WTT9_PESFW|nr:uncharacterized protein PFICI_11139 [Pestalotiopsis fici W106-1]ETS77265.1 hypothetical protein PFICI_11139 [Pestalotiopsis fici W106-1]
MNQDSRLHSRRLHYDRPFQRYERDGPLQWEWFRSRLRDAPIKVPQLDPIPRGFRLIDVEEKKVVRASGLGPIEYACLSYVWGNNEEFQSTKDTIGSFGEINSLGRDSVPATIKDAITICNNHLGIRYLWVDRLCIVQDDVGPDGEKQEQIEAMGRIYNHAAVTLVAAEGDASAGFPGVTRPFVPSRRHRSWNIIRPSRWAQRGWTYQEAMLSRRMFIFATEGIYFEREQLGPLQPFTAWRPRDDYQPLYHYKTRYSSIVKAYTKRTLGNEADIINAFHGICCHMFDKHHRFGIPTNGFHDALLWFPSTEGSARERRPPQGCNVFPSWSWSSVRGAVTVHDEQTPLYHVAAWAFADKIDAAGNISMTFAKPRHFLSVAKKMLSQSSFIKYTMKLAALASRYGCTPATPMGVDDPHLNNEDQFVEMWPSSTDLWRASHGVDQNERPALAEQIPPEKKQLAAASGGHLLGFSQTLRLSIAPTSGGLDGGPSHCAVYIDNKLVGVLSFDDKTYLAKLRERSDKIQCIALSTMDNTWLGVKGQHWHTFGQGIIEALDKAAKAIGRYRYVFMCFMAIESHNKGLSRRVGIGFIPLDDWVQLKPTKTFFVLA